MKLKKGLGFLDVFALASGAMISSGIFILPGLAFAKAGPSVFLSYFFAGLLALTGALNVAELSSAMPRAGGDYFFITRSMGPLVGTVSGMLSWFALSLKTAFAIIGIAEIIFILSGFDIIACSILATLVFVVLNIIGVSAAGKFEIAIVFGLLAIMAFYTIAGLPKVKIMNFEPFTPNGFNSTLVTSGFVFVSFGGLLKVASISEEIDNPKVNIPAGIFASLGVVTLFYSLLLIVTVGTLDGKVLSGSTTPISDSARAFLGQGGFIALTIAAMLAFISTGNAGIMSASRYPYALSRDSLLPDFISKLHPGSKTPIVSIIMTGIFIIIAMLMRLEVLVKAASTVVILTYILANLSTIILRESHIQNYQPSFKAPLYPWVQIIGIIAFILLIYDMGWTAIATATGLIALGVAFYFAYGKRHSAEESALTHLIARITDKKLGTSDLEEELKGIISERDNLSFDRFDDLVRDAEIIDIDEKQDLDSILKMIADILEEKTNISSEKIFTLLQEREKDYSTAISPFVAVPHLVLEGTERFHLIVIRCKEGISFSDMYPDVKALFVLAGSRDQRTFHLQVLAAIAQIVSNEKFENRWLKARNEKNLRDLLILSDRRRIVKE
ncbi:MAG: amino acid permease [Candidatus Zixiibacteriota bacterium]